MGMRVAYDPLGNILWTSETLPGFELPPTNKTFIEVDPVPQGLRTYPHRYMVDVQSTPPALRLRFEVPQQTRDEAIAEVNRMRGDVRRIYITVLPGQEMIYMNKEREAIAYMAVYDPVNNPDPDPLDYPSLMAEVGITAPTLHEMVQLILNLAAMWRIISDAIEPICLGAINTIENAATFSEVDNAVEYARQALEALKTLEGL